MKHVLPKQDRTVSKADRKFMEEGCEGAAERGATGMGQA